MVTVAPARRESGLYVVSTPKWDDLRRRLREFDPKSDLGRIVKSCFAWLPPDLAGELLETITRCVVVESSLALAVLWHPDSPHRHGGPLVEDRGVVSRRLVTNAGVGFLVDAFQNSVELEAMKYHALGTSSQAEAVGDTGCVTELTTQYTGNVRATGSTEEGTGANVFKSIGTNTMDEVGPTSVQEHALMSQAATGGGVCLDRSLTGTQTLGNGDGVQTTYQWTATAGG